MRRADHVAVQTRRLKPCFCRDLSRIATSRLRLQKMVAFLKSAARGSGGARFRAGRAACRSDQALRCGDRRGGRAGHLDAHGIMEKSLGQPVISGGIVAEKTGSAGERHQLADTLDAGMNPCRASGRLRR